MVKYPQVQIRKGVLWMKKFVAAVTVLACLVTGCGEDAKIADHDRLVKAAQEKDIAGDFPEALDLYKQAAAIKSTQEIEIRIAGIELSLKSPNQAEENYKSAMELWADQSKRDDGATIEQIYKYLSGINYMDHPDAKEMRDSVKAKMLPIFIDRAQKALEAGDLDTASRNNGYASSISHEHPDVAAVRTAIDKRKNIAQQNNTGTNTSASAIDNATLMNTYENSTGSVSLAIGKIERRETFEGYTFPDGKSEFLLVGLSTKNYGYQSVHANPLYFVLVVDNRAINPDTLTYSLSNYFEAGDLPPGTERNGWLVFAVPKDATDVVLRYDDKFGNVAVKRIFK